MLLRVKIIKISITEQIFLFDIEITRHITYNISFKNVDKSISYRFYCSAHFSPSRRSRYTLQVKTYTF